MDSVLICFLRRFWIPILIVSILTASEFASGVANKKAEFNPVWDVELIGVIDPSNNVVVHCVPIIEILRALDMSDIRYRRRNSGGEHLWDRAGRYDYWFARPHFGELIQQKLVLPPLHLIRAITKVLRPPAHVSFHRDVPSNCFPKILGVQLIHEGISRDKFGRRGEELGRFDWFEFYPSAFVNPKGFRTPAKSRGGNLVLLQHRTPHERRYYGVNGDCVESSPSSVLYRFLSGVIALILGSRISYRLLVVGDDRPYFKGVIMSHLLIPFSLLCTAYGIGALVQCVLYLTQPCEESHADNNVSQKHLTRVSLCNTVSRMANVLSAEKQTAIIAALAEGSSIRGIERITGVHRDTIMRLGARVGQGCTALLDEKMRNLPCRLLQFDEVWGFIGKKERHVRPDDDPQYGNVWTFCAIDAETKLVPSFKCGKRDLATAKVFVADVQSRMAGRVQISSDALSLSGRYRADVRSRR